MVVVLTVFLLTAPASSNAGDKYQEMINCDLHQGACTRNLSGSTVTFAVTPRPVKAMQDLLFQVAFSAKLPPNTKLPYIDLGMPGMKMGPNRRTWRATITVPDLGQTDFIFDVIY